MHLTHEVGVADAFFFVNFYAIFFCCNIWMYFTDIFFFNIYVFFLQYLNVFDSRGRCCLCTPCLPPPPWPCRSAGTCPWSCLSCQGDPRHWWPGPALGVLPATIQQIIHFYCNYYFFYYHYFINIFLLLFFININ